MINYNATAFLFGAPESLLMEADKASGLIYGDRKSTDCFLIFKQQKGMHTCFCVVNASEQMTGEHEAAGARHKPNYFYYYRPLSVLITRLQGAPSKETGDSTR